MIKTGLRYFIASLLVAISSYTSLHAQVPGRVDTLFNKVQGFDALLYGGIMQSDCTIIAYGNFTRLSERSISRIAKMYADGSNDYTFNPGTGANGQVYVVLAQPDGKLLVCGAMTQYSGATANRLFRISQTGARDATFTASMNGNVLDMELQTDGKIIAVGNFTNANSTTTNRIVRLNSDGTKDGTFSIGTGFNAGVYAVAIQADGKYIVSGDFTSYNGTTVNRLARINTDGSLDNTFNNGGAGLNAAASDIYVLPNKKIAIGGSFTTYNGTTVNRFACLDTTGTRDSTFNIGTGFNNPVYKIFPDQNGKLVIGGTFTAYNGVSYNRIVRVDTTGTPDSTFAIGTGFSYYVYGIFQGPGSDIYATGEQVLYNGYARIGLTRINNDGSIDPFMGHGGFNGDVLDAAVQSDGKVVVVGNFTRYNDLANNYIARFNADGTYDNTFNSGGAWPNAGLSSIGIQSDNKIIVGGSFSSYDGNSGNRIARLNSDGSYDNTFQKGTGFSCCGVNTIVVLPNDKMYIGTRAGTYNGVSSPFLIKLNADGTKDNSLNIGTGFVNGNNGVTSVHIQNDGKLIVAGDFPLFQGQTRVGIVRLNPNGTLDPTFDAKSGTGVRAELQPDGKILVGGFNMSFDGVSRQRIARLNTDGTLDLTYNVNNTSVPGGGGSWPNDIQYLSNSALFGGTFNTSGNLRLNHFDNNGVSNTVDFYPGGVNNGFGLSAYVQRIIKDDKFGRIIVMGQFLRAQDRITSNVTSLQNYIDSVIVDSTLCAGAVTKVYFQKRLAFNSGNIFTVQLSNASGSFTSPVTIGIDTIDGGGPDSIQITIPVGTAYGAGYKIRVVSTDPVFTSWNTLPFTINALPIQKTVQQAQVSVYPSLGTEIKIVASQTGVHYSLMDDTTVVDTGSGNGDTLRLHTNSIYNTTDFTIVAQVNGCNRVLDTVIVDTLGIVPVSWKLEGIAEYPDHSLHMLSGYDKSGGESYNWMKPDEDGFLLFRFETSSTYAGLFGIASPEGTSENTFMNILMSDTNGGWDSTGLYLSIDKEEPIFRRGLIGGHLDVAIHKLGNTGHVYYNGIRDTIIDLDSTLYYVPIINPFEGAISSIKGVYSSYGAILHGTVSGQNATCGNKGIASAAISGGSPPYSFHWSNGDTTDTPDSLLIGMYVMTVTDYANDTLIDSVYIGYNALLDTSDNVEPDTLGRLVSVNNTAPYSSYASYTNTLLQSEDGWIEFRIPEGTSFQGYVGIGNNLNFDENTFGLGILIVGDEIYIIRSDADGMTYMGYYEAGEAYALRIRFDNENVYFGKREGESYNEMPYPLSRTTDLRPAIVPMATGSILPDITATFGCEKMFAHVMVTPATSINTQGQARLDVKGGTPPYIYAWSNSATAAIINALPGTYTVTVTDQNSSSITAQAFIGAYVQWLAANNVAENGQHEIVGTANTPTGYSLQYNYIFGSNALKPNQDGVLSFDFGKAGDFSGSLGLATDYQLSYGSKGFGVVVIQDRMNIEIDPDLYYIDEAGDLQYFGSFKEAIAMNIKVKKQGNDIEIMKNDVGGITREFDQPYIFHPYVSPVLEGDKVTRVTADFGVPLQAFESVQHVSCSANTLGSISLDVIGGQPPYHYSWAHGDTTGDPDSLSIGLYTVTVWDSQLDTIVDSIYVGYDITWDTTFNVDDTLGMLVSTGNNSTASFDSYAYGLNSLAPGEDGWVEFVLPENSEYNGALSMTANKYYDETSEGLAMNIVSEDIMLSGSMLENSEAFSEYKTAVGYRLRMEFIGDDIIITAKDLHGLAPGWQRVVNYERTKAWSPSIIFGLNGAKVASVSSSFGCGKVHAEARIEPAAKNGGSGSIYIDAKGGVPPYTYAWSNSATTANLINVPIGRYTVTVEDQMGDEEVVHAFLGRYVDWDVLSNMVEEGTGVIHEGDTVDFDSTIVSFAFAKNAIKPGATGTVSFDFERTKDFTGVVGLAEYPDFSGSQDGALIILAVIGDIDEDKQLYVFDESGSPAFFGKLRENLPVNLQMKKTPLDFTITKNGISDMIINRATTAALSPVVVPGLPGDKVQRVTCDFGQRLSVNPIVTPILCGTANTGSITAQALGGVPPYEYHWNTGDTTDVNDSLIIGEYNVIVVDSIGDTAVAYITMGYGATWYSLVGVTAGGDNSLSATLPFSEGNAYAVGASILYPIVGETGWMEFKVDAGVPFEGYFGLVNEMTFDENMVGIGILISGGHIYSSNTDPENENMYLGRYNQGLENNIRITKVADDEIEISVNGVIVLSSEYEYPSTFKPVVYLNSATSKVRRLVSSFCNTYQDDFTIAYEVVHNTDKRKGGIYIEPVGGTPPFEYAWSDLGSNDPYFSALYSSNVLHELGIDSTDIDSIIANYPASNNRNRSNLEIGTYTVTVTDAASHTHVETFTVGYVSKFAITNQTLTNDQGVITKTGGAASFSDNACISLGSCNDTVDASFSFQILSMGDFDFGYRDLSESLLLQDLSAISNFDHDANEYYYLEIRSGQITYKSGSDSPASLGALQNGDVITMSLIGGDVLVKKNGVLLATKVRNSSPTVYLHTVARLYHPNSSFKILENVLF